MARGSLPAAPAKIPGLPTNTELFSFEGFDGINTKPARMAIGETEMYYANNFMPLGRNNLRTLYDVGTPIYSVPQPPAPPSPTPPVVPTIAARYWGIYVMSNCLQSGNCQIGQVQMRATPGSANLATNTAKAAATSTTGGVLVPGASFSGNANLYWESNGGAPQRLYYDFGAIQQIQEITIQGSAQGVQSPNRFLLPNTWKPQYSNDAITWTDVPINYAPGFYDGATKLTWHANDTGTMSPRRFVFAAQPVYYRLNITANNGGQSHGDSTITIYALSLFNATFGATDIMADSMGTAFGANYWDPTNTSFGYGGAGFGYAWNTQAGGGFKGTLGGGFYPDDASLPQYPLYYYWAFFWPYGTELTSYTMSVADSGNTLCSFGNGPRAWTLEKSFHAFDPAFPIYTLDTQAGVNWPGPANPYTRTFVIP